MATPVRVLILEDRPADAELMALELRRADFEPTWERVDREADYLSRLDPAPDLILADYTLPGYSAPEALRALEERGLDVPFIIVTGTITDETAVECMRAGAADYLLKDRLGRLGVAVTRALAEKHLRDEKHRADAALWEQDQRLRLLLDQLPAVAWSTDRELRFTSSLGAGLPALGLEPDQAVGTTLADYFRTSDPTFPPIAAHIRALQGDSGAYELQWLERTLQAHVAPLRATDGAVTGCIGVALDVTEQKRQMGEMSQQLWQAAKLATMGELAASVAHELNNPMATVSLRIESLLGELPADDPRRRELEIVEQELDRMAALVANLLQFSRRGGSQISSIDLRAELEAALDLIHYRLRTRGILVAQEFAPDLPLVQADRQLLRQLVLNLLTNASDAMPQGGTLTIRAARGTLDGEKAAVLLEFTDTGVGIAPEDLPKVMEPFYTTKGENQGTGLGLPICRRIVQEHGGTIAIESEVGRGTTVRVGLPLANGGTSAQLGA